MTCLDEGTLQAYLDGELSPETLNGVAAHLAACAPCTEAARAADAELALFFTAFAPVLQVSVPTEILRARLDHAIAELNAPQRPVAATPAPRHVSTFFASIVASLTTFTPRQATAFASFLVAVALAVVFFALMRLPDNSPPPPERVAQVKDSPLPAVPVAGTGNGQTGRGQVEIRTADGAFDSAASMRGKRRPANSGVGFVAAGYTKPSRIPAVSEKNANAAATTREPVLEDEKTYLSPIASLSSAIEAQGAEGMTPTLRAEYERNLAVVNQAIVSSRVAARRNPQDTDAKEFLRAAYQNKVELLSAVADQTQLASGRD